MARRTLLVSLVAFVLPLPFAPQLSAKDGWYIPLRPHTTNTRIMVGQTKAEVEFNMLHPSVPSDPSLSPGAKTGKGRHEIWFYYFLNARDGLSVEFHKGKVKDVLILEYGEIPAMPKTLRDTKVSRGDRIVEILGVAADVAARVYMMNVCHTLRSRPLILLNSYDLQTLYFCSAAGF